MSAASRYKREERGSSDVLNTELIVNYEVDDKPLPGGGKPVQGSIRLVQYSGGVLSTIPISTPKFNLSLEGQVRTVGPMNDGQSLELKPTSSVGDVPVPGTESASEPVELNAIAEGDSFTIRAVPSGSLQGALTKFVSGQLGDFPEVTIEIPNGGGGGGGPCEDRFSSLFSNIEDTKDKIRQALNNGDRRITSLEDIVEEIQSETGADIGGRLGTNVPSGDILDGSRTADFDPPSLRDLSIEDISRDSLEDMSRDRLKELKGKLEDTPDTILRGESISELRERLEELRDEAEDLADPECETEFTDMIQNMLDKIPTLEEMEGYLRGLHQRVSDLLSGITGKIPGDGAAVDCAEAVGRSLRNRISTFQEDARSFVEAPEKSKTARRMNKLQQEGQSILDDVRSLPEECQPQYERRVENAISDIRGEGVRRDIAVPCSDRFSSIYSDVESFREKSTEARTMSLEDVRDLIKDGENLVRDVQREVPSGECRNEFEDSIDGAISRLRSLTRQTRINIGERDEARESRDEVMEQIRDGLSNIQESLSIDSLENVENF